MEHLHLSHTTPDGWQKDSVGHLIVEQPKSPIKVSDAACFGSYPFFTSGDDVLMHTVALVEGDNIYLATGGQANIKHYYGDASYSTDTYVVKSTEEIDTTLLYYYLTNIRSFIDSNYFQGSGLKHLQKKDFKKHELCFPKDIEEQKRIAALLTQIDSVIADTKKLIDKYRDIKIGLMQDLLTKGIDENGNIRSEETHEFKDSELGRIPVEWECTTMDKLFDLVSGITPSRSNTSYFNENGTNWVKTLDLNEDYLFNTEEKLSDLALKETSIRLHPSNTLLLAMYGGWIQIGRTSIIKNPATTNQAIVAFYPKGNPVVPIEYVQFFLQVYKHKWKKCAISTRKDPNISKKDVLEFSFIYPLNFKEAEVIVDHITKNHDFLKIEEEHLVKLKNQREGLLKDLLSGHIQVPSTIKL